VDVGSYVTPGQTLAQIYAADAAEVLLQLSDEDAALIPDLWAVDAGRAAQSVPAAVYADYGAYRYRWEGYVDRAEAALDPESRTINVVLRVPRPFDGAQRVATDNERGDGPSIIATQPPPLFIEQYVDAEIAGARLDRYVTLPRRALRRNDEVWAVQQDSLLQIVEVDVIQLVDETLYVRADLDEGQPIITSDLQVVTDGMTVRLASNQDTAETQSTAAAAPADSTAVDSTALAKRLTEPPAARR
jgi:hypothetical protein